LSLPTTPCHHYRVSSPPPLRRLSLSRQVLPLFSPRPDLPLSRLVEIVCNSASQSCRPPSPSPEPRRGPIKHRASGTYQSIAVCRVGVCMRACVRVLSSSVPVCLSVLPGLCISRVSKRGRTRTRTRTHPHLPIHFPLPLLIIPSIAVPPGYCTVTSASVIPSDRLPTTTTTSSSPSSSPSPHRLPVFLAQHRLVEECLLLFSLVRHRYCTLHPYDIHTTAEADFLSQFLLDLALSPSTFRPQFLQIHRRQHQHWNLLKWVSTFSPLPGILSYQPR
jgi:hypothetical protein